MLPEEQLQRLYLAGFDLQTFERFPKAIGVLRDGCLAFLYPVPTACRFSAMSVGAWEKAWGRWWNGKEERSLSIRKK